MSRPVPSSPRILENAWVKFSESLCEERSPRNGISALIHNVMHRLQDAPYERLGWTIDWQTLICNLKLHRGAYQALQQGIVEFLHDARALGKPKAQGNTTPPISLYGAFAFLKL